MYTSVKTTITSKLPAIKAVTVAMGELTIIVRIPKFW